MINYLLNWSSYLVISRCHQRAELLRLSDVRFTRGRSLLRGRDRRRRPAGPRRRRTPGRRLFAPLGRLELRRQHIEHHLHVLVSAGLHVLVKLQ